MEIALLILVCVVVGAALFGMTIGKDGVESTAAHAPGKAIGGILFFAVLVFLGLAFLGMLVK